jgi:NodT family efflux transporter outer membrane factor (OMF) lipoprotein
VRSKSLAKLLVLTSIVMLCGCSVGPAFERPEPSLPDRWGASGGESPQTQIEEGEVDARWWAQFGDPVLSGLIDRARESNLDLRVAALRVAQARAQRNAVAGNTAPNVSVSGSYSRQRQSEFGTSTRLIDAIGIPGDRDAIIDVLSEPYNVYQVGFDTGWELDLWGRLRRAVESADASFAASTADLHGAQVSVIGEVARVYLELRGTQDQLRIARNDVQAGQDLLELTRFRADGGLVTQLDVVAQQARLAESRARIPQLEQRETQLIDGLSLLLGEPPGALRTELAAAIAPPAPPSALMLGVPSDLARRRPDIRAAEARLQAATAEIGVAVADLYPRITLTGGFLSESLQAGDLTEWGARQWSVGPSLSLPIFDSGRRRSVVELRNLQQQEAAVRYQRTVLAAWHEIDTTLDAYARERKRNEELTAAVSASRDAYELASTRYRHGMTDFLIPLDAQRTLLQSERALSESNTLLTTQVVALYKALGGGWK